MLRDATDAPFNKTPKRRVWAALGLLGMSLLLSNAVLAASPKAKVAVPPRVTASKVVEGNAAAGLEKSESERCQECHGADGNGAGQTTGAAGKFAKLAGQYPDYFVKQIQEFRSGARKHDFMAIMAKSVDDADIVDIAAYFGSLPVMQGDGTGDTPVARKLFQEGDPARGIAACASCHGERGKGLRQSGASIGPVIGGQEWRYLDKQLREWRSGERHNSAGGVMNQMTKSLTDAEIEALANYVSGL